MVFDVPPTMVLNIPSTLAALEGESGKSRKGCRYSDAERAVLSKYKEEYKSKTTPEAREQVLKQKVFVDIFNYWYSKEGAMPSEEESKKRVAVFDCILITLCTRINSEHRNFVTGFETTGDRRKQFIRHQPKGKSPSWT